MWEIVYKSYSWRFANVRKLENELFKGHWHCQMLSETNKKQLGISQNVSLEYVCHMSDRRHVWFPYVSFLVEAGLLGYSYVAP